MQQRIMHCGLFNTCLIVLMYLLVALSYLIYRVTLMIACSNYIHDEEVVHLDGVLLSLSLLDVSMSIYEHF